MPPHGIKFVPLTGVASSTLDLEISSLISLIYNQNPWIILQFIELSMISSQSDYGTDGILKTKLVYLPTLFAIQYYTIALLKLNH